MTSIKSIGALFLLLLVYGISCSATLRKGLPGNYHAEVMCQDTTALLRKWQAAINSRDSILMAFYTPQAVKVSEDSIWTGPAEIYDHYLKQDEIGSISRIFSVNANKSRGIEYEMISFGSSDTNLLSQLVIYEQHGDRMLRTFEFTSSHSKRLTDDTAADIWLQLNKRRNEWMAYCNAHQVSELVNDLYSMNTLYFNHRPLVKGRMALVSEYGYMSREQYSLTLEPLFVHVVNETTVFEIGQCKGSYNGKYVLIWKKEEDGQWRIFVDSNV